MTPLTFTQLPAMARLVRLVESWPDQPSIVVERDDSRNEHLSARADLRDRMGQIVTIDRADTARSIAALSISTSN
jgi:hypothetical protein